MLLVVTTIGMLVHVYSIGYMSHDPSRWRFFAYLNLFMFSMLLLVLAGNYLLVFAAWELVGLSSYLLIGFWYDKRSAALASKKAFLVNRVGDVGFALGIMAIWTTVGTLNFTEVFTLLPEQLQLGEIQQWMMVGICLLLFCGAMGKSAQFPLHVWLPDAMEGPTPVSALIHAATMVNAGVYLIARSSPLFAHAPEALILVAAVGIFTAIFAASIALTQKDIKRVLAYSTLSQLGLMFAALGVGAWIAAIFHLVTHGIFKGLLFLGSGSVIHGVHEEQDMDKMGGLRNKMPITHWTMLIGALAISGIPPLAGFFSKDEILGEAFKLGLRVGLAHRCRGRAHDRVLHVPADGQDVLRRQPRRPRRGAEDPRVAVEHDRAAHPAGRSCPSSRAPSSACPSVTRPSASGWSRCSTPPSRPWGSSTRRTPSSASMASSSSSASPWRPSAWSSAGGCSASSGARRAPTRCVELTARVPRLYLGSFNKWYFDELNDLLFVRVGGVVANGAAWFDVHVIDGAVNGIASVTQMAGDEIRQVQTGRVQNYALGIAVGLIVDRRQPHLPDHPLMISLAGIPILSLIIFAPLVGALILAFVPGENLRAVKAVALGTALVTFGLSLVAVLGFDIGAARLPVPGDGVLDPVLRHPLPGGHGRHQPAAGGPHHDPDLDQSSSPRFAPIKTRVKEYMIAFLALEVGMLGVFLALDLFLFYIFWEIVLVPMYLIIGIWGGANRIYATMKFVLYTLVGSLLMLVAILATAFTYQAATGTWDGAFNLLVLRELRIRQHVPVAVLRCLLPGLRHQGAHVAVPHVAAGCTRGGADGGLGDPRGGTAQARWLRLHPLRTAAVSRRRPTTWRASSSCSASSPSSTAPSWPSCNRTSRSWSRTARSATWAS